MDKLLVLMFLVGWAWFGWRQWKVEDTIYIFKPSEQVGGILWSAFFGFMQSVAFVFIITIIVVCIDFLLS